MLRHVLLVLKYNDMTEARLHTRPRGFPDREDGEVRRRRSGRRTHAVVAVERTRGCAVPQLRAQTSVLLHERVDAWHWQHHTRWSRKEGSRSHDASTRRSAHGQHAHPHTDAYLCLQLTQMLAAPQTAMAAVQAEELQHRRRQRLPRGLHHPAPAQPPRRTCTPAALTACARSRCTHRDIDINGAWRQRPGRRRGCSAYVAGHAVWMCLAGAVTERWQPGGTLQRRAHAWRGNGNCLCSKETRGVRAAPGRRQGTYRHRWGHGRCGRD
jgi:hypothetical protein